MGGGGARGMVTSSALKFNGKKYPVVLRWVVFILPSIQDTLDFIAASSYAADRRARFLSFRHDAT